MFELCVLFQVANDLKSGDLCIADSDRFRDYRLELLSWEQVGQELVSYGEQAGISTEPKPFIAQLRKQLEDRGRATDKGFPDNRYLRFENGEPILTPVEAVPDPEGLDQALSSIRERLEPIEILDAFADTEHGVPLSLEPKRTLKRRALLPAAIGSVVVALAARSHLSSR